MQHQPLTYTPQEVEASRQETLFRLFNESFKPKDPETGEDIEALDPAAYAPGTLGCHEALHTASIALNLVDVQLLDHPAVALDAEAYRLAHDAHLALFNLYQHLGVVHLLSDDEEEK